MVEENKKGTFYATGEEDKVNESKKQKQNNNPRAGIKKQKALNVTFSADPADSTTTQHLDDISNVNNKLKHPLEELNLSSMHNDGSVVSSTDRKQSIIQLSSTSSSSSSEFIVNPKVDSIKPTQTEPSMSSPSSSIYYDHSLPKQNDQRQLVVNISTLDQSDNNSDLIQSRVCQPPSVTTPAITTTQASRTGKYSLSGTSHNVPNVFFTKAQPSDEQEDILRHTEVDQLDELLKGFDRFSALRLKKPRNSARLPSINKHIQAQTDYQDQMLTANPVVHEPTCHSASSSPRMARSNHINPDSKNAACSLNVPSIGVGRKLSLQPFIQQSQAQSKEYLEKSPQTVVINNQNLHLNNNNNNNNNVNVNTNNGLVGSSSNLNNLAVSSQLLAPRKSVIGRLERSSFQTQRLSDVGVAFGQQITAKMGLKLPASQERIVEQTRWLYLRYIFVKLRLNALPLRDLNLSKSSRARRAAALGETMFDTPRVSTSAPVTAPVITPDIVTSSADSRFSRKRTAVSHNLNSQDINFLARVNSFKSKNEDVNEFNDSTPITSSNTTAPNGRKYIMDPTINNQIFTVILTIVRELRDRKPEFYGDTIYELIGIDKFSSLQDLLDVQKTICQEMTRSEISWCRIIALFSLFGAVSLDCVRLGIPEHVGPILDGFIEFVERDLALWISLQGGWESFLYKYRAGFRIGQFASKALIVALPVLIWIFISMFSQ